ncbi:MAG: DUF1365 domain-containing protein [Leptospirales bacterium]|nr:DUF1365 domain-containing protein [Leptospirales bacterium]
MSIHQNNSSLYECRVTHVRRSPVKNSFSYGIFMFALDLDELEELDSRGVIGLNRPALYSLYDSDHLKFLRNPGMNDATAGPSQKSNLRKRLNEYAKRHAGFTPSRIVLLTNLRVFGYVFNPVSFYYLYLGDHLRAVLAEVNNTYLEQKDFLIKLDAPDTTHIEKKHFYVSPFIAFDSNFHFTVGPLEQTMRIKIDTVREDQTELHAVINGKQVPISRKRLVQYLFKYPLVTLRIIVLIHYQALKLFLRRVPHFGKIETDNRIRALKEGVNIEH